MNVFSRSERFEGHLLESVPNLYVCGECGGKLLLRYTQSKTAEIECRNEAAHKGLALGMVWDLANESAVRALQQCNRDELQTLLMGNSPVSCALRTLRDKLLTDKRTAMYGDDHA